MLEIVKSIISCAKENNDIFYNVDQMSYFIHKFMRKSKKVVYTLEQCMGARIDEKCTRPISVGPF